ncbi:MULTISPECIES: thioesterase family protein [Ramlibacter]|uniref:Thioesterase family protein n=1 Tax=Ramlibacter aquaticus TaxID=2780094 RepID=A0ABR9SE32_9BURK|nr:MULTISPECIES: thioesterase family protein [Ramlibacter]MBE7940614.1 thioesterase family protein [Ramlibacter aquaticus]
MSRTLFDEAVALAPAGEGCWTGHTHPGWANMIGPFGGISAAALLHAVLLHPQRLGEPVSLTVNFAAAVADGPYELRARPARTNRSTQHWWVEMLQGGETVLTATAITAVRRDTFEMTEALAPVVPRPLDLPRSDPARVTWTRRYDLRVVEGEPPATWDASDSGHSRSLLWMRDDPHRPLDWLSLTALADVFIPRIWRRRATLVPLGTVTMTVYYHAGPQQLAETGTGFVLGQAQAQGFRAGYNDQAALLWNEAGTLLASSHQWMYYKE